MHSLACSRKPFYWVFATVLVAHLIFLLVQIKDQAETVWSKPAAIKIKIVRDALKELSLSEKKQIVQSEDSTLAEKRENAFLSDKDRAFDRETISKKIDLFKKAAKGNAAKTQKAQKDIKLSDLSISNDFTPTQAVARKPASESDQGLENGDPAETGLSATNDYVEEVKLGDFTHLNTVEYKHYGFFHRIRQKLEQFWGRSIQEKTASLFRSGRKIASQDYATSLQVTLNAKGEITAVKIMGASGVKELDDAAIESFNQAGPFPNPPKDLLVNGFATIQWGFIVKS